MKTIARNAIVPGMFILPAFNAHADDAAPQCWEFIVQANTPGNADGRQAMWLDGKLVGKFDNIRWRFDADLKINCFWLQHYGYDGSDPTRATHKEKQTVWFDDVVVARDYIGPRIGKAGK
jgi:hypothetical protein